MATYIPQLQKQLEHIKKLRDLRPWSSDYDDWRVTTFTLVKKIAGAEHAKLFKPIEISGSDIILDKLSYKTGILSPATYLDRLNELEDALNRVIAQSRIIHGIADEVPQKNESVLPMKKISPRTIDFLADVITGGPGNGYGQGSPWPYKTGPAIHKFFRGCNYQFVQGAASRVPWTESCLEEINNKEGSLGIKKIVEHILDPQGWLDNANLLKKLVEELNKRVWFDGFEIIYDESERRYFFRERGAGSSVIEDAKKIEFFNARSIELETKRMLDSVDRDPPDAVTAACSLIETVAKQILDRMSLPYPAEKEISSLVNEVRKGLKLMPDDVEDEQFKHLLRSLSSAVQNIGIIRTRFGDAHGHVTDKDQIKPHHARFAVNAAATISRFLVEAYEDGVGEKSQKVVVEAYDIPF